MQDGARANAKKIKSPPRLKKRKKRYIYIMTIQDLEAGVSHLRPKELKKFRAWFEKFDADEWDKEFEADANSGRLESQANQALKDFSAGKCTPL